MSRDYDPDDTEDSVRHDELLGTLEEIRDAVISLRDEFVRSQQSSIRNTYYDTNTRARPLCDKADDDE